MNEQNKQVVLKFIEAMGRGDRTAAAPCLAPDAFTLARGFGKFAGVRRYDLILATIEAFRALVPDGMRPEILSVTAEGDRVIVEFEGNAVLCNVSGRIGEAGIETCRNLRRRFGVPIAGTRVNEGGQAGRLHDR
jgi:hypothetical protein